ncbi:MAG: cytidine deaminase [Chitinophagales bacterium]|nr:MAG: cytidine deaminase [Chitinophagales bacterium]
MNHLEIQTVVRIYAEKELPEEDRQTLLQARQALSLAYAPYSRFQVGAAIRMSDGQIVRGSNQENAAFPLGICAERIALAARSVLAPNGTIISIAITSAEKHPQKVISPCGMCRQALLEAELRQNHPIRIVLDGSDQTVYVLNSAADLLPLPFSSGNL